MAIQKNTSHIPNEIIEMILSRLPVKSLLRFKSISRSWNTMISDHGFIRIHHRQSVNSDSRNLFLRKFGEELSLVGLKGRKFQTEAILERPQGCRFYSLLSIGDGIALFGGHQEFYREFVLWNPCTQQELTFQFPYDFIDYHLKAYGLCHDPCNDDFKAVVVTGRFYAVYSCKNGSRTKKNGTMKNIFPFNSGISADGAIYWVSHDYNRVTGHTYKLVYFDPRDDNFKILQKPENVKDNERFRICCLKGCLCLYCNIGGDETTVQIWIKEKGGPDRNSWKVMMNIENLQRPVRSFGLLTFQENKIVLVLYGSSRRILVYSPGEKTYEKFEDRELNGSSLYPVMDTMFSPERIRVICS